MAPVFLPDGSAIYGPDDERNITPKGYIFIFICTFVFIFVLCISLAWICVRREIIPIPGSKKHKERQKFLAKSELEFRKRVYHMMKQRQLQIEIERVEKEKEEMVRLIVEARMKGVEAGRREVMREKVLEKVRREILLEVDVLTEESAVFEAMRRIRDVQEEGRKEKKRVREEKRKGELSAKEVKKQKKVEKKEKEKQLKMEQKVLMKVFKEEWELSLAAVKKREKDGEKKISGRDLARGMRKVPCLY
ncbi:hypothetical protein TWF718_007951 [Orbilia javanica]|uniref:Uncharacterized protein n=1 Tax=Orbilia javanica TaxID=47235 RepID=A0AAN8MWB5_9PEZI